MENNESDKEVTLVILKPEAVIRNNEMEILKRLENKFGKDSLFFFSKENFKNPFTEVNEDSGPYFIATIEQTREHYKEHEGKEFYDRITKHLASSDIMVLLVKGRDVRASVRK